MKKIAVITGSRAEYGLQKNLLFKLKKSKNFNLFLIATASHLSNEYGFTLNEINQDNLKVSKKIETLLSSNTSVGISKSFGLGVISFSEVLNEIKPDLIILTGDRYEMLSVAVTALFQKIPIAHIHGGEKTVGSYDDSIRHSITKMSNFHFVANNEYKKRVIQLGEDKKNIFNVGGLGVDNINILKLITKKNIEKKLKINFKKRNILITYHPETSGKTSNLKDFKELIKSLEYLSETNIFFTMPNADNGSKDIIKEINIFSKLNKNVFFYNSLGQSMYFSLVNIVDCVIGNSSSGISEIPSFKKPTINIGDRQKGRIYASSVINVSANCKQIKKAIEKVYSKSFQNKIKKTTNPYGKAGASEKIIKILDKINFTCKSKDFKDIEFSYD